VVRPRFCRVIYYFDTPTLGRRHQSFGRVKFLAPLQGKVNYCINYIFYFIVFSFLSFYLTFVCFVLFCFVSFVFLFFSSILFSSYTCMRVWSRTLSGRLCRVSSSFSENMTEEDNQSLYNENNRVRTLRDHMNPTRTSAPSCIVLPPDASHFNFKPDIIQLLSTFHGLDLANPYLHLREFKEVCNTYNDLNCSMNTIRLKLFYFSLKDQAKTWLQNLRPESIRACTNSFKRQITTFT